MNRMFGSKSFLMAGVLLFSSLSISAARAGSDAKIIEAAKKEGNVSYYTTMILSQSKKVVDKFQEKYPFIKPELFRGGPRRFLRRPRRQDSSAKQKRSIRRNLLHRANIDTSRLTNIDQIDAALCALAVDQFVLGNFKPYGDTKDGFIVVPGRPLTSSPETAETGANLYQCHEKVY